MQRLRLPPIESTCRHGHELERVAGWLLDCLDRRLPEADCDLTLYLCHHPQDHYFANETHRRELARLMHQLYLRENDPAWQALKWGALRFDLRRIAAPGYLELRRRGYASQPDVPSAIELAVHATEQQAAPGTLALVR